MASLAQIRAALAAYRPTAGRAVAADRKAAVAAVLRERADGVELLFIRRAEHPRDPWSGHMAFPGGRVDRADVSPLATAVRETREELSLDLEAAGELIGELSEVVTHLRAGRVPRTVAPFVFALHSDPELTPNAEVEEPVWVPLAFLADRANRASMVWVRRGVPLPMPCYRYQGRVIWGLTLRMVDELLRVAGAAAAPA